MRAGRVIRTFGEPGRFYSMTNIYLFADGRLGPRTLKFWCMWSSPPRDDWDPTLINLATTEKTYGPQTDFDADVLAALRLPESDSAPTESAICGPLRSRLPAYAIRLHDVSNGFLVLGGDVTRAVVP